MANVLPCLALLGVLFPLAFSDSVPCPTTCGSRVAGFIDQDQNYEFEAANEFECVARCRQKGYDFFSYCANCFYKDCDCFQTCDQGVNIDDVANTNTVSGLTTCSTGSENQESGDAFCLATSKDVQINGKFSGDQAGGPSFRDIAIVWKASSSQTHTLHMSASSLPQRGGIGSYVKALLNGVPHALPSLPGKATVLGNLIVKLESAGMAGDTLTETVRYHVTVRDLVELSVDLRVPGPKGKQGSAASANFDLQIISLKESEKGPGIRGRAQSTTALYEQMIKMKQSVGILLKAAESDSEKRKQFLSNSLQDYRVESLQSSTCKLSAFQ